MWFEAQLASVQRHARFPRRVGYFVTDEWGERFDIWHGYVCAVIASLLRAGADPQARNAGGATFPEYLDGLLADYPSGDFSSKVRRCREVFRQHAA